MKRLITFAATAAMVLGLATVSPAGAVQQVASSPTSTTENVTPYVLRNDDGSLVGPGGNVTCDQVGVYDYQSDRTDDSGAPLNVTIYDVTVDPRVAVGTAAVTVDAATKLVDFTATIPIEAVIVKGGDDANIYDYGVGTGVLADTGLGAPPNASGGIADLSNITFCSNEYLTPPPDGEWCSPGYWRQPQHLDSWVATGIAPTEKYLSYFDASTLGRKAPAGADPTLLEVLEAPEIYGGEAFNNVGDLLSDAHPDVDWSFGDERTEDSCPLD